MYITWRFWCGEHFVERQVNDVRQKGSTEKTTVKLAYYEWHRLKWLWWSHRISDKRQSTNAFTGFASVVGGMDIVRKEKKRAKPLNSITCQLEYIKLRKHTETFREKWWNKKIRTSLQSCNTRVDFVASSSYFKWLYIESKTKKNPQSKSELDRKAIISNILTHIKCE